MGRSRAGLTTKIHALVDAEGRPVRLHLSEGQKSDCANAEPFLGMLNRDAILIADKGYDTDAIRSRARTAGAFANIPAKRNREQSLAFGTFLYRYRNLVERFFGKLKNARGLATRYDKRADNFLAALKLFSARIWIRSYEPTPQHIPTPANWRTFASALTKSVAKIIEKCQISSLCINLPGISDDRAPI